MESNALLLDVGLAMILVYATSKALLHFKDDCCLWALRSLKLSAALIAQYPYKAPRVHSGNIIGSF